MQKVSVIILSVTIGLFYSCTRSEKNTFNKDDRETELGFKLQTIANTPDSLRSAEDKVLFRKLEAVIYEKCVVENGRFEITVSKKDVKKMGLSEIWYDKIRREIDYTNNLLDTISFPKQQMIFDAFRKSKEEYRARKESQHLE
ncbi:MAG: hypothetical protein FWF53_05755 [Candidatus Azobacteroides sp.]|nr:hypothetical protein [Candidatus Azobacteroides sp.]